VPPRTNMNSRRNRPACAGPRTTRLEAQYDVLENRWLGIRPGSPGTDGEWAAVPRMHSAMHLSLVRYTPIFCRPYTRGADRQPCAIAVVLP
jgi:hypothetical protein